MTKEELYSYLLFRDQSNQMIVAIEEMTELSKELIKAMRGKGDLNKLLEEYTDVTIMLEQVKQLYNFKDEDISKVKHAKLKRLEERFLNNDL